MGTTRHERKSIQDSPERSPQSHLPPAAPPPITPLVAPGRCRRTGTGLPLASPTTAPMPSPPTEREWLPGHALMSPNSKAATSTTEPVAVEDLIGLPR